MKLSDLKKVLDESTRVVLCDPFDKKIYSFDGIVEFPEKFSNWKIGNLSVAYGRLVVTVFEPKGELG